jgi:hypothetical protein
MYCELQLLCLTSIVQSFLKQAQHSNKKLSYMTDNDHKKFIRIHIKYKLLMVIISDTTRFYCCYVALVLRMIVRCS